MLYTRISKSGIPPFLQIPIIFQTIKRLVFCLCLFVFLPGYILCSSRWNIEFSLTNEGNHRGVCMKCQDTPAEKACRILSSGMDAVRNGHTKNPGNSGSDESCFPDLISLIECLLVLSYLRFHSTCRYVPDYFFSFSSIGSLY